MHIRIPLTERDREILETLTLKVKLLTLSQIARTWWSNSNNAEPTARRRLKTLAEAGLVTRISILAHPELELSGPVATWEPGGEEPDFGAVSYRLNARWIHPFRTTGAFIGTREAANHFGGYAGRLPKDFEQNHDVHLAAVYLFIRQTRPTWAKNWISEPAIRKSRPDAPGEKLPDGMIRSAAGHRVIEFGGSYSKEKVSAFHSFCERKGLPYDLW